MNVLNVNSMASLESGGGAAERTFHMSRYLAMQKGVNCTVLSLDIGLDSERIKAQLPASLVVLPTLWKRFYVPFGGWGIVKKLVNDSDIVHLMGHWSILNAIVYIALRYYKKPYVVCPAGSLPLYGRSKFLKNIYNKVVGYQIIKNANRWIAVTKLEVSDFVSYGVIASKVEVIPNAISKDDFPNTNIEVFRKKHSLPDKKFILFLGRLNYIKGPDLLLKAFFEVSEHYREFDLIFAGPDEGMLKELIDFIGCNNFRSRVHFLGFLNGLDKVSAYRLADLMVVPSRQEAMSIVVLEAGICRTVVLVTDQCGFDEIKDINPHLQVPATLNGLVDGLNYLLSPPVNLQEIGLKLETYISGKYLWKSIINQYIKLYENVLLN
jgi:glycosyltransferase involved in cell wall biosynthesis